MSILFSLSFELISEDLSEEERKLPLHKISVIDEGEQRQVSNEQPLTFSFIKNCYVNGVAWSRNDKESRSQPYVTKGTNFTIEKYGSVGSFHFNLHVKDFIHGLKS